MIEIWYAILTFMLTMYVVLEGFDIGAGMLQFVVGKTEAERRTVIAAIGPLWSWHEVWLLGFGGTLLLAFPAVLAVSFAGFYLALMLLLWGIILRGVSIEVSGHLADPLWRTLWHVCFVGSNLLLAVLIGAALGNVLRGVPLGADGKFSLAFFTNFDPRGNVGILDWYTLSAAVFVVILFAAHGANGLAQRTEGPEHERSLAVARLLWMVVPVLLAIVTLETWQVRPEVLSRVLHQPFGWLGLMAIVVGLAGVFARLHGRRESGALLASSLFIAGLMIAGATGIFPLVLYSTLGPEHSMSAYQTAAAGHGLSIALVWWPIAALLSIGYFVFIYRYYSGKVKPVQDTQMPY
ncbi:MAG TPA: cytochrome d ubiquinol oxidase subunit II [Phycisphaerae bacterium]|nr:cytochrome d ubiquinol oxidase subunit II [Phycisphaerae bacterium]